jgi:hypothetical protein
MKLVHDVITNEIQLVNFNDEELADLELRKIEISKQEKIKAEIQSKKQVELAEKAALLEKLGLSFDEAKLLLG